MIELLHPCGFDTLEYSGVNATIGICMLADYSVAKKCQHIPGGGINSESDRTWAKKCQPSLENKLSGARGLRQPCPILLGHER
jgi:hypothetical protein